MSYQFEKLKQNSNKKSKSKKSWIKSKLFFQPRNRITLQSAVIDLNRTNFEADKIWIWNSYLNLTLVLFRGVELISTDKLSKISKIGPHPIKGSLLLIRSNNALWIWSWIQEIIISKLFHRWRYSWCRYDIQSYNSWNITKKNSF